jgi:hypothetical protein
MKKRTTALLLTGLLGLGIGVTGISPAEAEIDDFTACPVPDEGPIPDCGGSTPPNPPDDFTAEEPTPDPEPEPEDDGSLPPAPVDDVVVADANFTG